MEAWITATPRELMGFALGLLTGCALPTVSRAGYALASVLRLVRPRR